MIQWLYVFIILFFSSSIKTGVITESNNCLSTYDKSYSFTYYKYHNESLRALSAIFSSELNEYVINCTDISSIDFKCSNNDNLPIKEGTYYLDKVKGVNREGKDVVYKNHHTDAFFCYNEACPDQALTIQSIDFADTNKRTFIVKLNAKVPIVVPTVYIGFDYSYRPVKYCKQYSEKEIICKLRQMETLYQFQSHLFVKVEICKGILSPTKNVITIKGEVPQGERELYSDFIIQK